jgi:mono/diheme cytochrome c family protein
VCSGCHTYQARLIGPPIIVVKALYQGRPQVMADWIANPTRKRPDYPEMPPQDYLPPEVRLEVARYILSMTD